MRLVRVSTRPCMYVCMYVCTDERGTQVTRAVSIPHRITCRVLTMEVAGARGWGRPARRWNGVPEYDMRVMGMEKGMPMERET